MDHYGEIVAQHNELQHMLDLLAVLAATPKGVISDGRLRSVLAAELEKADSALTRHFEFEEKDGYMHELARVRPTLSPRLADLKEEHTVIRGSLDELRRKLSTHAKAPAISDDLRQLLRIVRKHEADENKLCQLALMHDIGCGD